MGAYDEHLDWLVPFDMRIEDEDARTEMGEKIRAIYTGGEPLADNLGDGIRVSTSLQKTFYYYNNQKLVFLKWLKYYEFLF